MTGADEFPGLTETIHRLSRDNRLLIKMEWDSSVHGPGLGRTGGLGVTVCLHTHRLTTGTHGEAGNVEPRQTGRLQEALPLAFATAPLFPGVHCYSKLRDPPSPQGKKVRHGDVMQKRAAVMKK